MNYQQLQGRYEVVQKFTARDLIKGGVTFNRFYFDFLEKRYSGKTVQTRFNDQSQAALWQSYAHWQHRFNDRLTMNSGLYFQHFGLNNTQRLEPRWSLQWQVTPQEKAYLTRLAPYQRIDLKTSFRFNRPKVNHYLFVELTNLLSEEVALTVRYDNTTKSVKTQYYGFKLLPLAGYRISWGKTRAR